MSLNFENWGLIDYVEALKKQEQYVEQIKLGEKESTVILCSHPAVVTLGRATQSGDLCGWQGSVFEVSRGGRATYHGPSQLVVYPLISIKKPRKNSGPQDIGAFLRDFENAIVKTLGDLNIKSVGKSLQKKTDQSLGTQETGVWVQNKKIASLGLAIRHWITFHGAAINVEFDPKAFQGMKPCGFESSVMTSIEEQLGAIPDRQFIIDRLMNRLNEFI